MLEAVERDEEMKNKRIIAGNIDVLIVIGIVVFAIIIRCLGSGIRNKIYESKWSWVAFYVCLLYLLIRFILWIIRKFKK